MKRKYAMLLPAYLALCAFAAMLAVWPQRYVPACRDGIALWAQCVLPALFPFMVITLLIIKTGGGEVAARPLKGVCAKLKLPPAAAVIFLMSVFSGYPAGSRIVYEYFKSGQIDADEAARLAPLCSTSGPMFILGSVGGNMLESPSAGVYLLAAHLLSVIAVSLALPARRPQDKSFAPRAVKRAGADVLYECFYSAVISVIVAGGFICFFYTLSRAAADAQIFAPLEIILSPLFGDATDGLCAGLIEATGGCAAAAATGSAMALPVAGFLVTFGGASILAQQLGYLMQCGVKPLKFIAAKGAQGALCFLLLLPSIAA